MPPVVVLIVAVGVQMEPQHKNVMWQKAYDEHCFPIHLNVRRINRFPGVGGMEEKNVITTVSINVWHIHTLLQMYHEI